MYMDKSIIKIILNYYNQLIISTIIIIINIILDFSRTLILTKLIENKVLIFFYYFASLWHIIKGAFNQVNMVCHTYCFR